MTSLPPEIFKAYDIRGIVGKTLTPAIAETLGRGLGTLAIGRGQRACAVGRDGRLSGPELSAALMRGLLATGLDVIELGRVTTPMTYFAAHHLECGTAVMITGSHNPPDYNGLKMVIAGDTLSGEAIQALRKSCEEGVFAAGAGHHSTTDVAQVYLDRIASDVTLKRPMKVAVDCGNGAAGIIAPALFRRLGCEVEELFCDVDGNFPNHHPDPSQPENLSDLIAALRRGDAEIGLAFDGDGDRLGVVTRGGHIIFPDRQLMLFAREVLARNPGAEIIYDVKCTRNLAPWISAHGGRPCMWKTGHSLIKAKLKETGAALAGEMSGHVFFKDRWYGFDDGCYAAARMLEILSAEADASAILDALPDALCTPELQLKLTEGENYRLIAELQKTAQFPGSQQVFAIDGLRVEYADGFGLARASNTTPVVVLRFEANDSAALERIQSEFRRILLAAKPGAQLPF
jgi:phosphomannomutase/phosphoglucomutase